MIIRMIHKKREMGDLIVAGTWKRSLNDTLGHANDAQKKEMGELIVAGVELRVTVRPVRGVDGQKRAKAARHGLA